MASNDVQSAQQALDAAKAAHRNDPDVILSKLSSDIASAKESAGKFHEGGTVPEDGVYELEAGEHVLTEEQADRIAPTVPENNLAGAFAKIGGKFVGTVGGKTPAQANAGAPTVSSIPENSPFFDHAARVLNTHGQALDIPTKSDLWDAFAKSRSSQELATTLSQPNFDHVPNGVKHELYIAHAALIPAPSHADKVVGVINHIGKLASTPEGKQMLEMAEAHPHVLHHLTSDKG
jgi:hypothetical protein